MKRIQTTKADETPEFVEMWEAWRPHMHPNDGRGDARMVFCQHVRFLKADPADIRDGAKWFIRNLKAGQWMPHCGTWINRCAYEDGAIEERKMQAREATRAVEASKPVSAVVAKTNERHFSRMWERGEVQGNA